MSRNLRKKIFLAKVITKSPNKAPETMPRLGTTGAPNRAFKQQYCNKIPDGGP